MHMNARVRVQAALTESNWCIVHIQCRSMTKVSPVFALQDQFMFQCSHPGHIPKYRMRQLKTTYMKTLTMMIIM